MSTGRKVFWIPFLATLVCGFLSRAIASPLDEWSLVTPKLEWTAHLARMSYHNGLWVAVGDGAIITSTNGFDWQQRFSSNQIVFSHVAVGDGVALAVGTRIARSTNGIDWGFVAGPQKESAFFSVGYGAGLFLVGGSGKIFSTRDGLAWETTAITNFPGIVPLDIIYAEGKFLAACSARTLLVSEDGKNWEYRMAGNINRAIAAGDGRIAIQSSASQMTRSFASTNGFDWEERIRQPSTSDDGVQLCFGNGRFVCASNHGIFSSLDGLNWSDPLNAGDGEVVAFGQGKFIALSRSSLAYSTNGVDWTQVYSYPVLGMPVEGNGRLLITTGDSTYVKEPGVDWRKFYSRVPYAPAALFWKGFFYRVGSYPGVARSADGVDWVSLRVETHMTNRVYLKGIASSEERLVAIGDENMIVTSDDGVNWSEPPHRATSSPYFLRIAYGNGVFVAVGAVSGIEEGLENIAVSRSGVDWSYHSVANGASLFDIAFGAGRFVASGTVFATSTNGVDWTTSSTDLGGTLGYGNGVFVYAPFYTQTPRLLFSQDGLQWFPTEFSAQYAGPFLYSNGRFYTTANFDGLYQSGRVDQAWLELQRTGSSVDLAVNGGSMGQTYQLERAEHLGSDSAWVPEGTFTNRAGYFEHFQLTKDLPRAGNGFFRLRSTQVPAR